MFSNTLYIFSSFLAIVAAAPTPEFYTPAKYNSYVGHTAVVNNARALAWYSPKLSEGAALKRATTDYLCYGGNVNNLPAMSEWLSFDQLWNINIPVMRRVGNPDSRIGILRQAIIDLAEASRVDARLILATMMQESDGNPNVPCTGDGNCGLMQAGKGSVSFDPSRERDSIYQMIYDGSVGTSGGYGLAQDLDDDGSHYPWQKNPYSGNPYAVTRVYNSGHIEPSGNLDQAQWGTPSYTNNIANRLLGWDASNRGTVEKQICGFAF